MRFAVTATDAAPQVPSEPGELGARLAHFRGSGRRRKAADLVDNARGIDERMLVLVVDLDPVITSRNFSATMDAIQPSDRRCQLVRSWQRRRLVWRTGYSHVTLAANWFDACPGILPEFSGTGRRRLQHRFGAYFRTKLRATARESSYHSADANSRPSLIRLHRIRHSHDDARRPTDSGRQFSARFSRL